MKQKYSLKANKYISLRERFTLHLKVLVAFLALILIGGGALIYDFYTKNQKPATPTSKATVKTVSFDNKFFSTAYFRFTDSGDWKFIPNQSTKSKFVFQKYLNNSDLVQHQLIVYVNSTPQLLDLAASRVLPVELNRESNSFTPMEVSKHCGTTYKPGELHKVEMRQISGSTLLCDPEQGQFRVILAKTGGDYNLKLKRSDGSTANYIIIYQNQKIDPDTSTILQIASSFYAT
jgi:hypothetical protein